MFRHLGSFRWRLVSLALLVWLAALLFGSLPALAAGGTCIDDITGTTNHCVAKDVRLGTYYSVAPVECKEGELVTVYLRADLVAEAKARYDIGLFVATDGGDAHTGTCYQDYLPPPLADEDSYVPGSPLPGSDGGPFFDAEDKDPNDTCGDLEKDVHTYYDLAPAAGITVPCLDRNGNGTLDISTCVTWDNNEKSTCQGVADVVLGTESKCSCPIVEVGNVTVTPGQIQAYKAASPDYLAEPGGDVQYTFVVTNTSQVSVTLTALEDSVYGDLTAVDGSTCTVPHSLIAGAAYSCSITVPIGTEPDIYPDTFTAWGIDPEPTLISDTATISVLVYDLPPAITVTKTADPILVLAPGGPVDYTVRVANNSGISDPLTLTSLLDDLYGDLTAGGNPKISDSTCVLGIIKPGESYQCTFTAQVTGEVGDQVIDTVTAGAEDDEGNVVEARDDAKVLVATEPPDTGIELPPPLVVGGSSMLGLTLLAAGAWGLRRTMRSYRG